MKKCKDCTVWNLMKEHESCKDSEKQWKLKFSISEMIMEKCYDCENFKLKEE